MKESDSVSRRYWVSCPNILSSEEERELMDAGKKKTLSAAQKKLESVFFYNGDAGLVLKTFDLEKAKEAAKLAQRLHYKMDTNLEEWVRIAAQPVCPKCEQLGRFSDSYCSSCGEDLLEAEDIEY
jgi:hypothetical protein